MSDGEDTWEQLNLTERDLRTGELRDLVPNAPSRTSDPPQSREAARHVKAAIVWECLLAHAENLDGLVDHELAPACGRPGGDESYRRRGSDLAQRRWVGWLRDAEGKIVRRQTFVNGKPGGAAGVRQITALGLRVAAAGDWKAALKRDD